MVNVSVELLSNIRNLWIRIPFQERGEGYNKSEWDIKIVSILVAYVSTPGTRRP